MDVSDRNLALSYTFVKSNNLDKAYTYEKHCQGMARQCFDQFIKRTNDENIAENLTTEAIKN